MLLWNIKDFSRRYRSLGGGRKWSGMPYSMTAPTPNNIQTLNDTHTQRQSLLGWLRGERAMPIDQMGLGLNPAVLLPSKSVTWGKWKSPGPQCSQMSTGRGRIMISDSEDSMRKCISQAFQSA